VRSLGDTDLDLLVHIKKNLEFRLFRGLTRQASPDFAKGCHDPSLPQ
jgi:hypothetical protein